LTEAAKCENLRAFALTPPGVREQSLEPTISSLIAAAEKGDGAANEALFSALYSEWHRMATRELARREGGISLSVTTLLHEADLHMAGRDEAKFPDRARFRGYPGHINARIDY
jgi:ECF sigma factor